MNGYTGIAESVIEKGETFREKAYVFSEWVGSHFK